MTLDALSAFAKYDAACKEYDAACKDPLQPKPPKVLLKLVMIEGKQALRNVDKPDTIRGKIGYYLDRVVHYKKYRLEDIVSYLKTVAVPEDKAQFCRALEALNGKIKKHNDKYPGKFIADFKTHETFKELFPMTVSARAVEKGESPKAQPIDLHSDFDETMYGNEECHKSLEMIAANIGTSRNKAKVIVDVYVNHKREQNPQFSITPADKAMLRDDVTKQMKETTGYRKCSLSDNRTLIVFSTKGEGSCGLHALLGEKKGDMYECDAQKVRKELCDWLRNKHKDGNLPNSIRNVLEDYFRSPDYAPPDFRGVVKKFERYDEYQKLITEYKDLQPEKVYDTLDPDRVAEIKARKIEINTERDSIIDAFVNDEEVFKRYLKNLEKVSQYLLQDEMAAAGECFNKKIVLYQPGWGTEAKKDIPLRELMISNGSGETVHIYYNGRSHYERAKVS